VGHIEMALTAAAIPFEKVTPQKWMKFYGMKKDKNETKTEWKKRLRERLQQLMPDITVTNNNADAYLIAYYNWKTNSNE
jgi:flagellar motor switch protein FliM